VPQSPGVATLVDLIRLRAGDEGDAVAFRYLADGGKSVQLTYAELYRRARALAVALADRGVRGEPVLLLAGPGLDFVSAFAGCIFAGALAVPAPALEASRAKRTLPRLASITQDARPALVLCTSELEAALDRVGAGAAGLATVPRLVVDRLGEIDPTRWREPRADAGTVAYLQYTSGSTSEPKGVMVTHGSLLSNVAYPNRIHETYTPETVTVSWMPHFHDYGLVEGIVQPLYNGTPSVLLSPMSFLRRPLLWLQAITRYRGTHSGGPTFAYEHCLRRIRPDQTAGLDLGSWIVAHVGAEPVREDVLDRFADAFGAVGFEGRAFCPSYGLAEATLLVSGKTWNWPRRSLRVRRDELRRNRVVVDQGDRGRCPVVSCGRVVEPMAVAIVDPESGRRCGPSQVGEIWVRGPSVAAGYWGQPEESARTFGARLRDSGDGPFLRTGDLGFLRDGELYLTGRLKELIIVAGVNHHPPDIELTVMGVDPELRTGGCAAFSVDSDGGERLVVAVEVERSAGELERLAGQIRAAIAEEHEIDPAAVVLVKAGSLPRTSSGKLRRHAVRDDYLEGALEELHRWSGPVSEARAGAPVEPARPSAEGAAAIEAWLLERLSARLELPIESLDPTSELLRLGLVSQEAVALVSELEGRLGRRLSPAVLWSHPTVRALSAHLAGEAHEPAARQDSLTRGAGAAEPIAIVGMACRLPGAGSPEDLWDLLARSGDAITEVPADRWDVDALYDPDPAAPGKMTTRWGGFLPDLDRFDAAFFGISPREAAQLDPRQRLMLELAWEGLEDAGIPPGELAGTQTGVFVATQSADYGTIVSRDFPDLVDAYSGPGNASSLVANRISYALDLRGPSLAVDTACSGSLVAVHLALRALESGEVDLALAGGVNVLLEPSLNVFFSKAGALAQDGRCKSFDSRADGIVRSDGAGLVVLKRLGDALRDGNRVRAVMLGSAVNQDGRSNGITAPNGEAQRDVLRRAYRSAGISPAAVQYVEAHGTGTSLGDPIEAQALGSILGEGRPEGRRCVLGALKTNIGHAESAAGIAGIIKTVLAIEKRWLPATLHFREPSPLIPFDALPLEVRNEGGPWPEGSEPLIAGVSGFGIGGTNAHVILAGPPPEPALGNPGAASEAPGEGPDSWLLPLSARSPEALHAFAEALSDRLGGSDPPPARDLCHSLARRRSHHPHRFALVAASAADARDGLARYLAAEGERGGATRAARSRGRIAFVFSGQGSHWPGMGLELLRSERVFAAVFEQCAGAFEELTGLSLAGELSASPETSRLDRTDVAQPAIFAVQVALAALIRSWGVHPEAVAGQSLGEVAAAHVAGALSLEHALRVVVARSRLMQRTAGSGRTAVVRLPYEQARLAAAAGGGRVSVAGSNSPEESVVSGEPAAVEALLASLEREGVAGRLIRGVETAFHGPQMAPLVDELVAELRDIRPRGGDLALYTALEGGATAGSSLDGPYWGRNLREPFRFGAALERMIQDGFGTFVEVAPHPVLSGSVRRVLRAQGVQGEAVPTLHRDHGARADALAAVGVLYGLGHDPDWTALTPAGARFVGLPRYPWQRERHWIADRSHGGAAAARSSTGGRLAGGHPLLGPHLEVAATDQHLWQKDLAVDSLHFLDEARVGGRPVVSEAVLLEMARAAAAEAFGAVGLLLRSVAFGRPLALAPEGARRVQTLILPTGPGRASLQIASRPTAAGRCGWTVHARAELVLDRQAGTASGPAPTESLAAIRARCAHQQSGPELYRQLQDHGRQYGPAFRVIDRLWEGDGEVLGRLSLPREIEAEAASYDLHPAVVDAGFQLLFRRHCARGEAAADLATPFATEIGRVWRNGGFSGSSLWCHLAPAGEAGNGARSARVRWFDDAGELLLELDRVAASSTGDRLDVLSDDHSEWFHELGWEPCPRPADEVERPADREPPDRWLLFAGGDPCGRRLRELLVASGRGCVVVEPGSAFELDAGRGQARIDPREPSHYLRLLGELEPAGFTATFGLVHLWSLEGEGAAAPANGLEGALDLGARSVFHLAQALVRRPAAGGRLWVVTRGAQAVGAPAVPVPAVGHSVLWGLLRGIGQQEHPELWGGIVDLDPGARSDEAASSLLSELLGRTGEDQVAFRDGRRLAPRLRRSSASPLAAGLTIWPAAAYLVTGGLGDLGLEAARFLAGRGARRLILVGRSGLPPRSEWTDLGAGEPAAARVAAVRALERAGAVVELVALDLGDATAVRSFFAERRARSEAPIRGVVHCAGVLRDRPFAAMEPGAFEAVLRPKVQGAWNLAEALDLRELDFLVLFSSVASFLVGPGQCAYAGANAFLDALAHRLRSEGVAAVSVNWGPWAGTGMATARGLAGRLARIGGRSLPVSLGLEILDGALAAGVPQLGVFRGDWTRFCRSFYPGGEAPRMLAHLVEARGLPPTAASGAAAESLLERLLELPEARERELMLLGHLRRIAASVLRLEASDVDPETPLRDLGIDSIMAVELKNQIEASVGVSASMSEWLSGPSVAHLATLLAPRLAEPERVLPARAAGQSFRTAE
jgi:acyl transferase domain-containing protein/acyl-CoA synthetase (AMP-forming)/AMP-acid ligase II/acyl carrier protein/short-subunit dehydrogenase